MVQEPHPHLKAVENASRESETASASAPPVTVVEEERPTPTWAWLALIGFFVCAIGWGVSHRQSLDLGANLAATEAELAATEANLAAHVEHLDGVRTQTEALAGKIETIALEALSLVEQAGVDPTATEDSAEQ